MTNVELLKALIDAELNQLTNGLVKEHVRGLLVEPVSVLRGWDYGAPGEVYPCWTVLAYPDANIAIAYCEQGFGPEAPWGLVRLRSDDGLGMSIGMDSGWFSTFLGAYFDSFMATDLPIWQVFKIDESGQSVALTEQNGWDVTWEKVMQLREAHPDIRYDCWHSVT